MKNGKIKQIITSAVIILACAMSVQAQKKNVLVSPTTGETVSTDDLDKIHAKIVEGLSNLQTVNILDATDDGAEADFIFKCNIDSVCIYPKKQADGKTTYVTEFNLKADVFSPDNEGLAWSIPVQVYNTMVMKTFEDKRLSAQSALEWVAEKIERKGWEPFAIRGQLLGVEESKNGKASKVSIEIGSLKGASKNQEFNVYLPDPKIVDKKGNLKENKPIGKVKVEDMGDEVSVCKVSGGGDRIYEAFLENPEQLTVLSKGPTKGFINDKKYQAQVGAEYIWITEQMVNSVKELVGEGISAGKEIGSMF